MKYQKIVEYKYRTTSTFTIKTSIQNRAFKHDLFILKSNGLLVINPGYMWDGVSGPTWDTKSTMRAGLVHDALYQAIRLKLLSLEFKEVVDCLFYGIMVDDKVWKVRAKLFYAAVSIFGHFSCIPGDIRTPQEINIEPQQQGNYSA